MVASQIAQLLRVPAALDRAKNALDLQEALIIALGKALADRDPEEARRLFAAKYEPATPEDWYAFHAKYLEAGS